MFAVTCLEEGGKKRKRSNMAKEVIKWMRHSLGGEKKDVTKNKNFNLTISIWTLVFNLFYTLTCYIINLASIQFLSVYIVFD